MMARSTKTAHRQSANSETVLQAKNPNELLVAWGVALPRDLLIEALTHRSFSNEVGSPVNYERLEFLGDSVLSIVTAEYLYTQHPSDSESSLSRMRAASVAQDPLARSARVLKIGDYVRLGKGEASYGGRDKASILSDVFEALVGATFLTHGFEKTRRVVLKHLDFLLKEATQEGAAQDWKTVFIECASAAQLGAVRYEVEGTGPDHARFYTALAFVESLPNPLGTGEGTSKKQAEHKAAKAAVAAIRAGK